MKKIIGLFALLLLGCTDTETWVSLSVMYLTVRLVTFATENCRRRQEERRYVVGKNLTAGKNLETMSRKNLVDKVNTLDDWKFLYEGRADLRRFVSAHKELLKTWFMVRVMKKIDKKLYHSNFRKIFDVRKKQRPIPKNELWLIPIWGGNFSLLDHTYFLSLFELTCYLEKKYGTAGTKDQIFGRFLGRLADSKSDFRSLIGSGLNGSRAEESIGRKCRTSRERLRKKVGIAQLAIILDGKYTGRISRAFGTPEVLKKGVVYGSLNVVVIPLDKTIAKKSISKGLTIISERNPKECVKQKDNLVSEAIPRRIVPGGIIHKVKKHPYSILPGSKDLLDFISSR